MVCFQEVSGAMFCVFVSFAFSEPDQTQLQQAHPPTVDAHELHRVALTRHLNEILRGVAF